MNKINLAILISGDGTNLISISDPNKIADVVSINLNINMEQKQELLEMHDLEKRLNKIHVYLVSEIDSFQMEKKIKGRVKRQMEKTQKEYYLNEQMKAIQKELGDNDDSDDEAYDDDDDGDDDDGD